MIAPSVKELVLVVRSVTSPKTRPLLARLRAAAPHVHVSVADDIGAIARCQLIVAASNEPEPLIYPWHLADGPVAICDISLPSDVSDEVRRARPDVLVIRGGIVRLPFNHDFSIAGISLPRGHALACMSETLLMGLEGAAVERVGRPGDRGRGAAHARLGGEAWLSAGGYPAHGESGARRCAAAPA